jgi:hypothetical protein
MDAQVARATLASALCAVSTDGSRSYRRNFSMRSFIVCLSLLSLSSSVLARDIFVDNRNGDDRRNGATPTSEGAASGPVRTVAKAIRLCNGDGDRIVLVNSGEPYREQIAVQGPRCSGTAGRPFEIVGNGCVLDGRASLVDAAWEIHRENVFRVQPKYMSFQQLFLGDALAVRRYSADRLVPDLQPLEWCLLNGYLYFRVEQDMLPDSYQISCCGEQAGITLYNAHDVVISDLVVQGFYLDGVNAHDNVRRTDLIGVTSINNGRSGFSVGGASRVRIDNCAAAGNGAAQVRTEGYSITQIIDGAFDPATGPALVREGGRVIVNSSPAANQ